MILLVLGCSFRTTPVEVRERLAFNDEQLGRALDQLTGRHGYEGVILSTCNRVEVYLGVGLGSTAPPHTPPHAITAFLAEFHGISAQEVQPHLYTYQNLDAV